MSDLEFAMGFAKAATGTDPAGMFAGIMVAVIVMSIIGLAVGIVVCLGWMKIFTKCGREGWAAFVPIYNIVVMCQLTDVPIWYMFIPFLNIFGAWKIAEGFDEKFGKNGSMKILLFLLPVVGYPMLGFGKDMPVDAEAEDDMQMGPMPMGPAPMGGQPMGPMGPMGPAPMGPAPMGGPVPPVQPMGPAPVAPVEPVAPVASAPVAPVAPAAPVAPVAPVAPAAPVAPQAPVAPLDPTAPQGPSVPPMNETPTAGPSVPPLMG